MDDLTKRFIDSYEYLKTAGFVKNDTEFATKLDVSRSMITEIMKGRSNPGGKALQNIVSKYPVDGNWLLTGLGEMEPEKNTLIYTITPPDSNELNEPAVMYKSRTPVAINGVSDDDTAPPTAPATINFEPKEIYLTPKFITVDSRGNENILYVPIRAAAGYLDGYADPEFIEKLPTCSIPGLDKATYRMFEVDGDSMYPTLENKQRVIGSWVEKLDYIREDRVHVVVTKTRGIVIKRLLNRIDKYGYIVAKSDALDDRNLYPNLEIYPDDILELWYGVMHMGTTFRHPTDMYKRVNNLEADLTEVLRVLKEQKLLSN